MVVFLVLMTVAVVLAVQWWLGQPSPAVRTQETLEATRAARPHAPRKRWLHAGHTWVDTVAAHEARVGVTDLVSRLLGRIDSIEWPAPGRRVRQGEAFVTLRHGRRTLRPPAPISGVVVAVNHRLEADPDLLNASPWERGWLVRLQPAEARVELRNLLTGVSAERWQDVQRMELARWFSPEAGLAAADGGLPAADLADRLDDDAWERLVETFFPEPSRADDGSPIPDKE
jgi:glycine cleavage system H protein